MVSFLVLYGVLAVLLSAAFWGWFIYRRERGDVYRAHALLVAEVLELRSHMIGTATAVPINVAIQTLLIKELTHYHTPEVDALLAKLGPPFTLTDDEERALLLALEKREQEKDSQITDSEREAARMLPLIIKRIKRDNATTTPDTPLVFQVVTTVAQPPESPAA